jgi:ribosomal protein S18 acetylase RimI-like enzyme
MNRDLRRVDAHARGIGSLAAAAVELPGFTAFFPDDAAWAVPRDAADEPDGLDAQLAGLAAAFSDRGRPLRVELVSMAWPALAAALAARGLAAVEETPLVVLRRPPPAAGAAAHIRWVAPGDDLAFVASLMRQGFELRGAAPGAADDLRAALAGPMRIAVAELDGLPAGSGCAASLDGVCEISSVSTLPSQRRRGVGAALVRFLAGEHFRAGGELCWACVPDVRAAGLFLDVGFEDAGLRVLLAAG